MTTEAERQRVRDRAADSQATHHEVIIRRAEWWPSPVSKLSRNEQRTRRRAAARAARDATEVTA